jgi:hypothetical protein
VLKEFAQSVEKRDLQKKPLCGAFRAKRPATERELPATNLYGKAVYYRIVRLTITSLRKFGFWNSEEMVKKM